MSRPHALSIKYYDEQKELRELLLRELKDEYGDRIPSYGKDHDEYIRLKVEQRMYDIRDVRLFPDDDLYADEINSLALRYMAKPSYSKSINRLFNKPKHSINHIINEQRQRIKAINLNPDKPVPPF